MSTGILGAFTFIEITALAWVVGVIHIALNTDTPETANGVLTGKVTATIVCQALIYVCKHMDTLVQ